MRFFILEKWTLIIKILFFFFSILEMLFTAFNIKFDFFYNTSSLENSQFVQDVFKKLDQAGHIYENEIIQLYCNTDKKFLPDRYVIGTCPYCKANDQYSDLCEK